MEMETERNVGRESERSDRPVKIDGFDLAAGKHGCEFRKFFFSRVRERYEERIQRYNMDRSIYWDWGLGLWWS